MHMQSCVFKDAINSWEAENVLLLWWMTREEDGSAGRAQITPETTEQPGWGGRGGSGAAALWSG